MAYYACGLCPFYINGICECNLSNNFKTKPKSDDICPIMKQMQDTVCYNFTQSLTNEQAVQYANYVKTKHPDKIIGSISVYPDPADEDYVLIAYESFPECYERRKKIL